MWFLIILFGLPLIGIIVVILWAANGGIDKIIEQDIRRYDDPRGPEE